MDRQNISRHAAFAALAAVVHPDLKPLTSQEEADRLLGQWWRARALVERLQHLAETTTDGPTARLLSDILRDLEGEQ